MHITALKPDEVFVFGSNLAGRHGRGAALTARLKFGAIPGRGIGMMGQSYGIPTKDKHLKVLSIWEIWDHIRNFIHFAQEHPEKVFLVTEIGCGLAGYKPCQIAPLFGPLIPSNVRLPESFRV
jgi:hypothetical protein